MLDCFRYLASSSCEKTARTSKASGAFRQMVTKSSARLITLDDFQRKNKDLAGINIAQKRISNFFNASVIVEQTEARQHVSSCGLDSVLLLHIDHEAHAKFTTGQ